MRDNTPDTEWEKEFDEKFNKAFCCDHDHYGEECGKEFATKCKSFIKKTLTSRDTYWKERVWTFLQDSRGKSFSKEKFMEALDNLN